MADDAITLITRDHRKMEKLFDRLASERDERPRLLDEVEAMLTAHSRAEEEKVYPVIVRETDEDEEVHHGVDEHHEAEELLSRLRDCDPKSDTFDGRLREFVDAVTHHVEEEENEILPALKQAVGKQRLMELGTAFSERREEELKKFGMARGSIPKQRELYEEAQELGIENRSQMDKGELADAVRKARRS